MWLILLLRVTLNPRFNVTLVLNTGVTSHQGEFHFASYVATKKSLIRDRSEFTLEQKLINNTP